MREASCKSRHETDAGPTWRAGNNDLLRDFDRRKKDIASMQVTLEGLKGRHRTLREQVVDMNAKTLQATY